MNESEFKAQFIAGFCASWCAANYADACVRGEQEYLEKPPMEDAIYLADCAWAEWLSINRK